MKFYAFLLGLAMPFTAFAQSNYKDGYIIKSNGDTIRGKIDLKEWAINPEYVDFKTPGNSIQRYKPADINGFYIEPDFKYISYTGRVSNNHNQFPNVDNERDTTTHVTSSFVKELVNGSRLSLYALNSSVKTSYFYKEEPNGSPIELNYYHYYYTDNDQDKVGGRVLKDERFFIQQLLNLGKSHPDWGDYTLADFERLQYRQEDITRAIRKINAQKSVSTAKVKNTQLFAGAGVIFTKADFRTGDDFAFDDASSKPGFKVAVGLNVFNNPVTQKVVFRTELAAEFIQAEANRQTYNAAYESIKQTYQIKRAAFSLTPQILYNFFNKDNLKVYAGSGISFSYNTYSKNAFVNGGSLSDYAYYPDYFLRKFIVMLPLQVGVQINKRIEGAVSYTIPHKVNDEQLTAVKMSSLGLTIRYLIN